MHVYLIDQLIFLFSSFAVGAFLSMFYDCIRILRVWRGNTYLKNKASPEHLVSKMKIFKLYNCYSENRHQKKRKQRTEYAFVILEDIFFSVISVFFIQVLVFGGNYGIPRMFSFFGIFLGFLFYRFTLGSLVMLISEYISYFVGAFIYYLLYPFCFLFIKVKKVIYKLIKLIYNIVIKKKLKNNSKYQIKRIKAVILDFSRNI